MKVSFKEALEINKNKVIACIVLWLILIIILVSPFAYSIINATNAEGHFNLTTFMEQMIYAIQHVFSVFGTIFQKAYLSTFIKVLVGYSILFFLFFLKGLSKTKARGEYHDIEHGSSDWCKKGEQYKVLSEKEGLLLAEDNYLPLDKRGNINVMVVGRFWFW